MKKRVLTLIFFTIAISVVLVIAKASSESLLVSNLESEQVKLRLDDYKLVIENLPESEQFEYLTAIFYKGSGYKSVKSASNSTTKKVNFDIPYYSDGNYEVAVFCGNDILTPFLPYTITLNIKNGIVSFIDSPTLESNIDKFNSSSISGNDMEYYSFYYLSENDGDEQVRNVAKSLVKGIDNNYDKAFAIYEWLTTNFYYKSLSNNNQSFSNASMKDLLIDKICDSRDFSTLYSYLLRAVGIPARSVYGIGLVNNRDASQSTVHHYWNEVYIDGRWIIVDVSMSCSNQYLDGNKYRVPKLSNIYFDSTIEFFSYSHSIISYETPAYYEGYKDIEVSNKPNGTSKTLDALGIPTYVVVKTSLGEIKLNVEWDLSAAKYDPKVKTEQSFTVKGTITLPSVFAACNSIKQTVKVDVTVNARYPIKLEIESLPNKLVYFVGEELQTDGLVLKATFDNGDVEPIRLTYETEYDFSLIGKSSVTVSYKDVETSFEVEVVSKKPIELKVEQEPDKKVYFVNETFDKTGLSIIAVCDGGLTYYVENYEIEYDFSKSGNINVVLTYQEISVIINVRVDDITPIKIELLQIPNNKEYYINSEPDFSNVIVEVTYNDGSKETISNELTFKYDFSMLGKTFVEVFYENVSTKFEISVIQSENNTSGENSDIYVEEESRHTLDNSLNDSIIPSEKRSYFIEIIGISVVSILLVVLSFFALKRANEMKNISNWIKNKK